jgi:chromosome partitioning protein
MSAMAAAAARAPKAFPCAGTAVRTVAIVNQKGGCGKTTTAINLAAAFARRGLRTLLVDMDPQSHCAAGLGVPEQRVEYSIGEALLEDPARVDRTRLVWQVARDLDLAPCTMRLAALEAPGGGLFDRPDRDRRLANVLGRLAGAYDRCLIDCPPTIGLLTFNALRAAREALVPVETGYFALKGAERQWETIQRVIQRIGRPIACHLLPTLHDPQSSLAQAILASLRKAFAGQIIPLEIRVHQELREAASMGQSVFEHAAGCDACRDYDALADWMNRQAVQPAIEIEIVERAASAPDHGSEAAARAEETAHGHVTVTTIAPAPTPAAAPGGRAGELAQRLRRLTGDAGDNAPPAGAAPMELGAPLAAASARALATVAVPPPVPSMVPALAPAPAPSIGTAPPAAPRCEAHRGLYGVRLTSLGVLFVQPGDGVRQASIAGDFNDWSPTATPLAHNAGRGVDEALVKVSPGRHQYRLVVDGCWQADPYNDAHVVNDHGERNSVFVVPEPAEST